MKSYVLILFSVSVISFSGCGNSSTTPASIQTKSASMNAVGQKHRISKFLTRETQLPLPNINPGNFLTAGLKSPVSPNGDWVITNVSRNSAQLERVSGASKFQLSGGITDVYGQTPGGSILLGVPAGGGGITEILNPKNGSVQKLPGKMDLAAHWVYQAKESKSGHWAMTVANSSGAGPTQRVWTDIDGKKVPALQDIVQYAWSPDGNTLAAVETPQSSRGAKAPSAAVERRLVLYNVSTREVQQPKSAVNTTQYKNTQEFTGWGRGPLWFGNGRYILYPGWSNLYVYDTQSGKDLKIPVQATSDFGFLSNGEIYVVGDMSGYASTLHLFNIHSGKLKSADVWKGNQPINGVVAEGQHVLIGIGGPSAGDARNSGRVVSLLGTQTSTIVSKGADVWWYDSNNGKLYFGDTASPGEATTRAKSIQVVGVHCAGPNPNQSRSEGHA